MTHVLAGLEEATFGELDYLDQLAEWLLDRGMHKVWRWLTTKSCMTDEEAHDLIAAVVVNTPPEFALDVRRWRARLEAAAQEGASQMLARSVEIRTKAPPRLDIGARLLIFTMVVSRAIELVTAGRLPAPEDEDEDGDGQ